MANVSPTQELELKMIGAAGQWNSFDGPLIESALRNSKALWRGAMLSRVDRPLLRLRDLQYGALNSDVLYIWAEPGHSKELETLVGRWSASEVTWLNAEQAFEAMGMGLPKSHPWSADAKRVVLQVWWQ